MYAMTIVISVGRKCADQVDWVTIFVLSSGFIKYCEWLAMIGS